MKWRLLLAMTGLITMVLGGEAWLNFMGKPRSMKRLGPSIRCRCRCGPGDCPLLPTLPSSAPRRIICPSFTVMLACCRWA